MRVELLIVLQAIQAMKNVNAYSGAGSGRKRNEVR
jgi:hypothetical protein